MFGACYKVHECVKNKLVLDTFVCYWPKQFYLINTMNTTQRRIISLQIFNDVLYCVHICNILQFIFNMNTWQFNSAKTIFAFSCPPQLRRRAKLFMSCCTPYLVHQYIISPFPNLHLPGEIFTCKGVKS